LLWHGPKRYAQDLRWLFNTGAPSVTAIGHVARGWAGLLKAVTRLAENAGFAIARGKMRSRENAASWQGASTSAPNPTS
jgi:hypothetical protein